MNTQAISRESLARPGRLLAAASALRARPVLAVSVAVILLVLGWALFPQAFTSSDPLRGVPQDALLPPSATHWFGTDHLGRDIYARTVHGTSTSLQATSLAVLIALFLGGAIGLLAGFMGGKVDAVLMRATDILMAIPTLLLSMAIVFWDSARCTSPLPSACPMWRLLAG